MGFLKFLSPTVSPPLTEKNLPSQAGKVFIVTGSTAGIGKLLAEILYQHNAKVYIAARSAAKAESTISELKAKHPDSKGELVFLSLDLGDLSGIKASAEEFLSKEKRLDVLWNNAGIAAPPAGSKTKQGYELQMGTNCLGPYLFTKLLTPLLIETAKTAPADSVRVLWAGSATIQFAAPTGGIELSNLDYKSDKSPTIKYAVSKAGNFFYGAEFARRYANSGVLSLSFDPGTLKTDIWNNVAFPVKQIMGLILHEPVYGAYTELFAGLSDTISAKNNGAYISQTRKDVEDATKLDSNGTSNALQFWDWSEKETASNA